MKKQITRAALFGGAILMAAAASYALDFSVAMEYKISGSQGFPDMAGYMDFSKPAGVHGSFATFSSTFTPNTNSVGAKYFVFDYSNFTTTGYCLEVDTDPYNLQYYTDPVMWFRNGANGPFLKLADDVHDTRFPKARMWLQSVSSTNTAFGEIYLAAFTSSSNNMNLYYHVKRVVGATESSCTSGQSTLPWVKLKGSTMTMGNNF